MFDSEWHTTKAADINLNYSFKIKIVGPSKPDGDFVNLCLEGNQCNYDDSVWSKSFSVNKTLHPDDAKWLRDQLIERFPLDAPKPSYHYYTSGLDIYEVYRKKVVEKQEEETLVATFTSAKEALDYRDYMNKKV